VSRDLRLYLEDMRDCCSKVLRYTEGMTLKQVMSDEKTFDAVNVKRKATHCDDRKDTHSSDGRKCHH